MAEYYGKLRASITRSESKPKLKLTEQTWSEASIVYTGKIEGVPVWFGLLIPFHKYADLKNNLKNQTINLIKISRFINYRDDQEKLLTMFGWGKEPPKLIKIWLNSNYDLPTIDENINVIYEKDDIRLCTIQRSTPNQLIGIRFCYYRQDQFHYIQLLSHSKLSLAYRAGLRNYDRIISINGTNVEQDRPKQPSQRLKAQRHLPLQILVSSPATYAFYKSNKMILHENLPSVQHLTPVFDTHSQNSNRDIQITSMSDTTLCIVQLDENKNICTIPQTAIFKSPDDTNINDICFVEVEQKQYRKARILFIGSYIHCQRWNETTNIDFDPINCYSASLVVDNDLIHSQKSLQENDNKNQNKDNCEEQILQRLEINRDTNERIDTILEQLPNELFFYLFNFLDASNLYGAFWGLNSRFNKLLQSCLNLTLIYEDSNDSSMLQYYSSRINGLTVDTSNICDFNQFPNLQRLTLYNRNLEHLSQIKPEILLNLTFLSFM